MRLVSTWMTVQAGLIWWMSRRVIAFPGRLRRSTLQLLIVRNVFVRKQRLGVRLFGFDAPGRDQMLLLRQVIPIIRCSFQYAVPNHSEWRSWRHVYQPGCTSAHSGCRE